MGGSCLEEGNKRVSLTGGRAQGRPGFSHLKPEAEAGLGVRSPVSQQKDTGRVAVLLPPTSSSTAVTTEACDLCLSLPSCDRKGDDPNLAGCQHLPQPGKFNVQGKVSEREDGG